LKTSYLDIRDEEGFPKPLDELEEAIGVRFNDRSWLRAALTHPSFWGDFAIPDTDRMARSYERLEFLGDSVIALTVCTHLFVQFPADNQGALSKAKAHLVSKAVLLSISRRMVLSEYLRIGKGVEESAGRDHSSFLVDCFEGLVGAIYMDRGFEVAQEFVAGVMNEEMIELQKNGIQDHKTTLQELAQKHFRCLPRYRLVEQAGPEHHKTFKVEVFVNGGKCGEGEGYSKKEAETAAAQQALENIEFA
jgi:ribonuclease III